MCNRCLPMEQWCSDCEDLFARSVGSSTSRSPPNQVIIPHGRSGLRPLSLRPQNKKIGERMELKYGFRIKYEVEIESSNHSDVNNHKAALGWKVGYLGT
jgi:hypothetical protein